jgi:hypothetical protein
VVRIANNEGLHYAVSSSFLLLPPFRAKYFPQHPVLEHPQSMFFPHYDRKISHPWKATGRIIVFFYILIMRTAEY